MGTTRRVLSPPRGPPGHAPWPPHGTLSWCTPAHEGGDASPGVPLQAAAPSAPSAPSAPPDDGSSPPDGPPAKGHAQVNVPCFWLNVPCFWLNVPYSWLNVPCFWLNVPYSWLNVPCFWLNVPYSWLNVPCFWLNVPSFWLEVVGIMFPVFCSMFPTFPPQMGVGPSGGR
jgi:hypothetical protein